MRSPLHALCPYFAMFPEAFVEHNIRLFTRPGDYVFDPFSGRGTTILQALLMARNAAGSDINPVAFCLSAAKADVPCQEFVLRALNRLECEYMTYSQQDLEEERASLPPFFKRAFYFVTLRQILFLRRRLDWCSDRVHRFIAALVLGSLQGEMDRSKSYFSNQMPRTICPKPGYSLRYWRSRNLWPKKRDIFSILRERAKLRLGGERPRKKGLVTLRDVREVGGSFPSLRHKVKAVITSPPYFNTTNTEEDQWLRLWFLGHEPRPTYNQISRDDRHTSKNSYWRFLAEAWNGIRPLVQPNAVLVCRLGAKGMLEEEISNGLITSVMSAFPDAYLLTPPTRSEIRKRQTEAFRPGSSGCLFEVDYVFALPPTQSENLI